MLITSRRRRIRLSEPTTERLLADSGTFNVRNGRRGGTRSFKAQCVVWRLPALDRVRPTVTMPPLIELDAVHAWIADGPYILRDINWRVRPGEHWALLGPNGSGKTTLLSLAGAQRHPSKGKVTVLGEVLGETSLWDLRAKIGTVDPNQKILDWLTIEEIVMTGQTNTVWPQHGLDTPEAHRRATELIGLVGCEDLLGRTITTCSQGERQRVRIARALMADPPLLLLDEPSTGLDLPAREALMAAMSSLASSHPDLASVTVSHHLEELPPSTSHAALLRDGCLIAAGPAHQTLTSERISECFGFPIHVQETGNRWSARAAAASW